MGADTYQNGWPQVPQQQGSPSRNPSNAVLWALVGVLGVFVLVALSGGIWWMSSSRQQSQGAGTVVTVTATATAEAPVAAPPTAPAPTPAPVPAAGLPGTLVQSGGYLRNIAVGSSNTSEAFALNVGGAYLDNLAVGGGRNDIVYAYSPATGEWYAMNCLETGSYVTCTGGNNAVVYIS